MVGQYPGIGAADLISFLVALTALAIAPDYVGFLGSAPIAIGTKNFYLWRHHEKGATPGEHQADNIIR